MKILYRILIALQILVGIGALAGGSAAILNPNLPLGISAEALKNSPFDNFLIPGIILFVVIGLGNLAAAAAVIIKYRFHPYISCTFSYAIPIWIIVQCIMLWGIHFLHIIFFVIGAVMAVISTIGLFRQKLFPASLIIDYYNKMSRDV